MRNRLLGDVDLYSESNGSYSVPRPHLNGPSNVIGAQSMFLKLEDRRFPRSTPSRIENEALNVVWLLVWACCVRYPVIRLRSSPLYSPKTSSRKRLYCMIHDTELRDFAGPSSSEPSPFYVRL